MRSIKTTQASKDASPGVLIFLNTNISLGVSYLDGKVSWWVILRKISIQILGFLNFERDRGAQEKCLEAYVYYDDKHFSTRNKDIAEI
jgi:hypothetical protein